MGQGIPGSLCGSHSGPPQEHPHAGIVVLGDFNRLRDAALTSYPLKQVVNKPTRKVAILDKIYTNLMDWYDRPVVLPNVGRSDHRAVIMSPSATSKWEHGQNIMVATGQAQPGLKRQGDAGPCLAEP